MLSICGVCTQQVKGLEQYTFLVSYASQAWIYVIKNTVKTVNLKYYPNLKQLFQYHLKFHLFLFLQSSVSRNILKCFDYMLKKHIINVKNSCC